MVDAGELLDQVMAAARAALPRWVPRQIFDQYLADNRAHLVARIARSPRLAAACSTCSHSPRALPPPRALAIGAAEELREHPWVGPDLATRIAADHLHKQPDYYAHAGKVIDTTAVEAPSRERSSARSGTVREFLMVLTSKITQADKAAHDRAVRPGSRGYYNPSALPLMFGQVDKIRAALQPLLDRDDQEALEQLKQQIGRQFNPAPSITATLKSIDEFMKSRQRPSFAARIEAAPAVRVALPAAKATSSPRRQQASLLAPGEEGFALTSPQGRFAGLRPPGESQPTLAGLDVRQDQRAQLERVVSERAARAGGGLATLNAMREQHGFEPIRTIGETEREAPATSAKPPKRAPARSRRADDETSHYRSQG